MTTERLLSEPRTPPQHELSGDDPARAASARCTPPENLEGPRFGGGGDDASSGSGARPLDQAADRHGGNAPCEVCDLSPADCICWSW